MAEVAGGKLTVTICLKDEREAGALYTALKAEELQPSPDRGRVTVSRANGCVRLTIEPRDLSSMRALMNSFLYLTHAAYSVLAEAGKQEA